MILYLDQGNSFVKWQLASEHDIVASGRELDAAMPDLRKYVFETSAVIDEIWIANVAGEQRAQALLSSLSPISVVEPYFFCVDASLGWVRPAYENLSTLGVDRWLLMNAAYARFKTSCMIISLGTAVVVDVLDENGVHLGGMIAPGWNTLQSSVSSTTSDIQQQKGYHSFNAGALGLGNSTEHCLESGASSMYFGFIQRVLNVYTGRYSELILCGGDAPSVSEFVEQSHYLDVNFVLDGMRVMRQCILQS